MWIFSEECFANGNICLKMFFHLICEILKAKIGKFLKLEKLEKIMKKLIFRKKTLSSLPEWESAKYTVCSQPYGFFLA